MRRIYKVENRNFDQGVIQFGEFLQHTQDEPDNSELKRVRADMQLVKNQLVQQQAEPADQTL